MTDVTHSHLLDATSAAFAQGHPQCESCTHFNVLRRTEDNGCLLHLCPSAHAASAVCRHSAMHCGSWRCPHDTAGDLKHQRCQVPHQAVRMLMQGSLSVFTTVSSSDNSLPRTMAGVVNSCVFERVRDTMSSSIKSVCSCKRCQRTCKRNMMQSISQHDAKCMHIKPAHQEGGSSCKLRRPVLPCMSELGFCASQKPFRTSSRRVSCDLIVQGVAGNAVGPCAKLRSPPIRRRLVEPVFQTLGSSCIGPAD